MSLQPAPPSRPPVRRVLRLAAAVLAGLAVVGGALLAEDANRRQSVHVQDLVRAGRFVREMNGAIARLETAAHRLTDAGTTMTLADVPVDRPQLAAAWARFAADLEDAERRARLGPASMASAMDQHLAGLLQRAAIVHDLDVRLMESVAQQNDALADGHRLTLGGATVNLTSGFARAHATLDALHGSVLDESVRTIAALNRWRFAGAGLSLVGLVALTGLAWTGVRRARRLSAERTARLQDALAVEARYKLIIGQLPVGVFQTDARGLCVHTSGAWAAITDGRCVVGDHWLEAVHAEDRARAALDVTSPGALDRHVYRLNAPEERWGSFELAPLGDGRQFDGHIGILNDVTELKRQEDLLHHSHKDLENLKFALDQHCIVAITDRDGRIQYANDKFCALSGYRADELVTHDHRIINSGHHSKEFMRTLWATITRGGVWKGELKNRTKDGSFYWVDTTIVPFLDEQGQPYQYIAIRTDITRRKQTEEALRQSGRMQAAVLNSAAYGIVVTDEWGIVSGLNRAALNLFGRRAADVVGTDALKSFLRPAAEIAATLATASRDGTGRADVTLLHATGREVPVSVTVTRFEAGGSGTPGYLASIVDITERMRVERELKATLRMQSDFVSLVSHQLRTPLTGIRWMLELAQSDAGLEAETRSHLSDAEHSAGRLVRLVNELLDTGQLEQGRLQVREEPVDLATLSEDVIRDLSAFAKDRRQRLVFEGRPVPRVVGDPGLLREVMQNLVTNAIQYSADPATITIRTERRADGGVGWAVADRGIGVPRAAQPRLFEKFFRADNASHTQAEGSGLGLHFAALVIARLQAEIGFESEEGRGSTFFFAFPPDRLAGDAPPEVPARAPAQVC